jgi:hypothetical protein
MDNDEEQTIIALKALWKSGRDKYQSFFTQLDQVQSIIGKAAIPEWCRTKLGIGHDKILKATKVLHETDEKIFREKLTSAQKLEKLEDLKHELEISKINEQLAASSRETARLNSEARDFQHAGKSLKPKQNKSVPEIPNDLIEQFKTAEKMCSLNVDYAQWAEGMRIKIHTLLEIRKVQRNYLNPLIASGINLQRSDYDLLIRFSKLQEPELENALSKMHKRLPSLKIVDLDTRR